MASSNRGIQIGSAWFQRKMNLRPQHRGVHLVTEEILKQMPEICQFSVGLFHVQILHTSASLALNESWDPDVRDDMEMMLNKIVPEKQRAYNSIEDETSSENIVLNFFTKKIHDVMSINKLIAKTTQHCLSSYTLSLLLDKTLLNPDKTVDMLKKMVRVEINKLLEGLPYRHSCEGPDDMPAHVKACFLGSSLTIPITDGKLNLGTWQGIWLCEHRDHAGSRKVVVTINGCLRDCSRSPLSPVSPIASTSS